MQMLEGTRAALGPPSLQPCGLTVSRRRARRWHRLLPGKTHPYPGKACHGFGSHKTMAGRSTILWQVRADGESPQNHIRIDQACRRGDFARGTVGADHEVGMQCLTGAQPVTADPPLLFKGASARPTKGVAPASTAAAWSMASKTVLVTAVPCPGYVSPSAQGSCTRRPVGPTTSMSPTSRPVGAVNSRSTQQLQTSGSDHVATRLVAREGRFVDQGDLCPAPSKHEGGDAARWAAPDDEHVKARQAHPAPFACLGSTVRSSHPREEACRRTIAGDRNRFAQQLFASLPKRYDQLAEVLSMGQNGRWRRAMVDHIVPTSPARMLDVASGTAGVALQLAGAHLVRHRRRGSDQEHARPGSGECGRSRNERTDQSRCRPSRAIAVSRRSLRRPDLHLPAALRRRSPGHAQRAGAGS